ncbi:MAG: hypothetical protein ACT4NL_14275 [Pseudomarimonas sp.]
MLTNNRMSPSPPSAFILAFATLRAALLHFFAFSSIFIIFGTIALTRAIQFGWLESFRLGSVEVPKFMGANATNVSVVVFCAVGILAIAAGYVVRYFYYRAFLAKLRARGVTDINNDGKTDVFTDRFLDDL